MNAAFRSLVLVASLWAPPGTMRILDLATNPWKEGASPPFRANLNHSAATYDADHNLVICKFGGQLKFWFYRYKSGTPADAFGVAN